MYQIIDATNDEIYDEFTNKRKAERECRHLNKVHNPPSYYVKKV